MACWLQASRSDRWFSTQVGRSRCLWVVLTKRGFILSECGFGQGLILTECGHENALFSRQAVDVIGQLQVWANLPAIHRAQATFYTDQYEVYRGVIPAGRHKAITKIARKTNYIERFHNTLRQRVSRLARETLAFSKKVENHIGAMRYN